ncbi:unnamed protein product [Effrenium voratum]|nr:unnamed protein product [Effrenium voratum]
MACEADEEESSNEDEASWLGRTGMPTSRCAPGVRSRVQWQRSCRAMPCVVVSVLIVSICVASGMLPERCQRIWHSIYLWSTRRNVGTPTQTAECAFDTMIGAGYLARGTLELVVATRKCPAVHGVGFLEQLHKLSEPTRELKVAPLASSQSPGNASAQVELAVARGKEVLRSLKTPINLSMRIGKSPRPDKVFLRGNQSSAAGRRLVDDVDAAEVLKLKEERFIKERICTSEVGGFIGAYSWVAAYLAAASTECTGLIFVDRYCASDVSRTIASIADLVQAGSGISAACTPEPWLAAAGGELLMKVPQLRMAHQGPVWIGMTRCIHAV